MYMVAQSSAKTVWIHKYKLSMSKWRSVLSSRAEVRSLPTCHLSFTRTQIMSKLPIRGDDRDSALLREQDIAQPKPSFPSLPPQWPCCDLISVSVICPTVLSLTKCYAGESRAPRLPAWLRSWKSKMATFEKFDLMAFRVFCCTFVWPTKKKQKKKNCTSLYSFSCSTNLFRKRIFYTSSLFVKIIKFSKDLRKCNM